MCNTTRWMQKQCVSLHLYEEGVKDGQWLTKTDNGTCDSIVLRQSVIICEGFCHLERENEAKNQTHAAPVQKYMRHAMGGVRLIRWAALPKWVVAWALATNGTSSTEGKNMSHYKYKLSKTTKVACALLNETAGF